MRQMISLTAVSLVLAFIFSCSADKNKTPGEPVPTQIAAPEIIVIDTLKVAELLVDTCKVDTFFVDSFSVETSMIDSFSLDTSSVLPAEQTETSFWNDLKIMRIKGNVRSLSETTYKASDKFGEIVKGEITGKNSLILFETTGMIREEQYFDSKGKAQSAKKNMYDSRGNKIENAYRSDGKLDNTKKISYDSIGNITEETIYNSEGILESKYKYKYIGRKLTEACQYNSDGNVTNIELYGYDLNGNKTEENFYNSEGEMTDSHRFIAETDTEGNLTVKDVFVVEGIENTSWEKFDITGNKIAQGSGKPGDGGSSVIEYRYDSNGNLIEERSSEPETLLKYEYEFDSRGNWIKKIAFEKKVAIPQFITERKIVYYE